MFCPKCGEEVKEGVFCPKCGSKVDSATAESSNIIGGNSGNGISSRPDKSGSRKSLPASVIGSIVIAVVGLLCLIVLVNIIKGHKKTLDLDKYVVVEFDGFNTGGEANVFFDEDSFRKDWAGKLKFSESELKRYYRKSDRSRSADEINEMIEMDMEMNPVDVIIEELDSKPELSQYYQLSNGDEIKLTWEAPLDEEEVLGFLSCLNCEIKYSAEREIKVSGLEEIKGIDPFEFLTVTFEGVAPHGRARLAYDTGAYDNDISFFVEGGIQDSSNGDEVIVSAKIYDEDRFVRKFGVNLSQTEKVYTVEGLSEYISTADDITKDAMSDMQLQAEDVIKAVTAARWSKEVELQTMKYLGNYFLTNKSDGTNRCSLVYELSAKVDNTSFATEDEDKIFEKTVYYYVTFKDLIKEPDGTTTVDVTQYEWTGESRFPVSETSWIYIMGFESLDDLYKEAVTMQSANYSCEDNMGR